MKKTLLVYGLLVTVGASIAAAQQITGTGATFPAVIYQKWFDEITQETHTVMFRLIISRSVPARASPN